MRKKINNNNVHNKKDDNKNYSNINSIDNSYVDSDSDIGSSSGRSSSSESSSNDDHHIASGDGEWHDMVKDIIDNLENSQDWQGLASRKV